MVDIINNPAVALYVAAGVALVVMAGFFVYLWIIDRQVRELQRALDNQGELAAPKVPSRPRSADPLRPRPIEKGAE